MRSRLLRLVLATASVCTVAACQTPSPEGAKKDAPGEPKPAVITAGDAKIADAKTPDPGVATAASGATAGTASAPGTAGDPSVGDPNAATAGAATADAATAGAATAGAATAGAATAGAATAGDTTAATAGDAGTPPAATAGDAGTPPVTGDKAKLLAEVEAKKTSDARAKKALEEAEAAGATVRELAEASNKRGVALVGAGEADRATAAFEWARDKDTTYPDASFNLAKQTALAGEIPETVKHLQEVNKRGGKKLLKTVSFDPTFEVVKDDPDVQKIAK